jgi:hypothetical protein
MSKLGAFGALLIEDDDEPAQVIAPKPKAAPVAAPAPAAVAQPAAAAPKKDGRPKTTTYEGKPRQPRAGKAVLRHFSVISTVIVLVLS